MTDEKKPITKTLPRHDYGRDPLDIVIDKDSAIEKRVRGCNGCKHLTLDASGTKIITACARDRKVGRKGKCSTYKEAE